MNKEEFKDIFDKSIKRVGLVSIILEDGSQFWSNDYKIYNDTSVDIYMDNELIGIVLLDSIKEVV